MSRSKSAAIHLRWMQHNLEGCDWCCGGGDQIAAALRKLTINEAPPCASCYYYDMDGDDMLCSKCRLHKK